jgi:hypothetical protein
MDASTAEKDACDFCRKLKNAQVVDNRFSRANSRSDEIAKPADGTTAADFLPPVS